MNSSEFSFGNVNTPLLLHLEQVMKIFSPGLPVIVTLFLHFGHLMIFVMYLTPGAANSTIYIHTSHFSSHSQCLSNSLNL